MRSTAALPTLVPLLLLAEIAGVVYAVHGKAGPPAANAWPTHRGKLATTGHDGIR